LLLLFFTAYYLMVLVLNRSIYKGIGEAKRNVNA